jgi:ABC-type thiamin/hydroxymethylpyrimidine transport system permease subunit
MMNKKGMSTAYAWVFGLVSMFGLGVMYITFTQVFDAHLVPIIKNQINSSMTIDAATKASTMAGIDKYMIYFHALPFILFFMVILFMILAAIRKESESI